MDRSAAVSSGISHSVLVSVISSRRSSNICGLWRLFSVDVKTFLRFYLKTRFNVFNRAYCTKYDRRFLR